uniref:MARVEL domain-containing protein n=1 Tax=Syphacia muris TaxID=451379 RepID=A0A0N5AR14_9BILA
MADPFRCLRNSAIATALWSILYSLIQIGIFGWQIKYCRDRQWELGNRNSEMPWNPIGEPQSLHPGLYNVYSETPEKRRLNALFSLSITTEVLACVHLCISVVFLIGAVKNYANCVWPWLISVCIIIITSTAYAILWWSGDVFGEQLAMSVAEFIMSLAVNGICAIVVAFYYARIRGNLFSDKPKKGDRDRLQQGKLLSVGVPEWKKEWDKKTTEKLKKRMKRKRSRSNDMRKNSRRLKHGDKFNDFSLGSKVRKGRQQRQFRECRADHFPIQRDKSCRTTNSGWTSKNSKNPAKCYNWLYLSQERLDAHNARLGKSSVSF